MSTALAEIQARETEKTEQRQAAGLVRWQKLRRWSRNDTAVWLNERSPAVLAWMRRRAGQWPTRLSSQMGAWIREYQPKLFAKAHERLTAMPADADRANALPREVLR